MKKNVFCLSGIFTAFFCVTALFSGCNKSDSIKNNVQGEEQKSLILGFSQIGTESSWRTKNSESVFEAAQKENVKLIFEDAQQKQSNQLKAIHSFIVYQVDVIAFVPIVEDGWDNVLEEAKYANIPVIILDRKIKTKKPELYTAFIGEDGYEEGKKAGQFLVEKFKNSSAKYNILKINGTEGSSVAIERDRGFTDVISKDKHFSVAGVMYGDFMRSRGKEIGDKVLRIGEGIFFESKPIDIIFSQNDSMTLGLLDSLTHHGVTNFNDFTIVSIDGEQEAIDALMDGKINCVVECNPDLGYELMKLAKKIYNGEEYNKINYINGTVFKETDDFSSYKPRGY